jgi:hypothetical protein
MISTATSASFRPSRRVAVLESAAPPPWLALGTVTGAVLARFEARHME